MVKPILMNFKNVGIRNNINHRNFTEPKGIDKD